MLVALCFRVFLFFFSGLLLCPNASQPRTAFVQFLCPRTMKRQGGPFLPYTFFHGVICPDAENQIKTNEVELPVERQRPRNVCIIYAGSLLVS